MMKVAGLVAVADAQQIWPTAIGGQTTLEAVSGTKLQFNLGELEVHNRDDIDAFSLQVAGRAQLENAGEPDLPILRATMAVPRGANLDNLKVSVHDAKVEEVPLEKWGSAVAPSKGKCPLCGPCETVDPLPSAYAGKFPADNTIRIEGVHTYRDVQYVTVEVQPVTIDHATNTAEVLSSCSISLDGMTVSEQATAPVGVEPHFFEAYKVFFDNWEHQAQEYTANQQTGRVLVVYDSQLESEAQAYAKIVKERLNPSDVIMYEAERSSSAVQSKIKTHYQETEKLAYVTIIGNQVASPRGSQTGTACDNCFVMMSGGTDLDISIGRISGDSRGVQSYLDKLQKYDSTNTAAWTKKAYGTYSMVMQDELRMEQNLDKIFTDEWSFSYKQDRATDSSETIQQMEQGLGVFSYIGHGSGTAWNTPRFSVSQVLNLRNEDKIFFELDVSCDNGDFQSHSPCMGEALIISKGGAIGTMMSSPTMKGTMCKRQQEQAATAIVGGTASRVGDIYNIGLMKGNSITRDTYAMQAYNVFGDPTQAIVGAKQTSSSVFV